jgi:epoxyqueuosine reductase
MSERERSTAPDDERLRALVTKLGESGLNVAGVASPVRYDELARLELRSHALAPGTRSIIVIGSGGGALWNALIDAIRVDPTRLSAELHPLDAFVQRAIEEADGLLGDGPRRWFFAAADASPALDFRVLGALAGLGARSRMGLLLHPEYGPWLGLRAACFTSLALSATPAAPDLCSACAAPCVTACAGDAMMTGSFDLARCSAFHRADQACERTCHSRVACPIGAQHRYPIEEITYHYHRRQGRTQLRVLAGVTDDAHEGDAPFWYHEDRRA